MTIEAQSKMWATQALSNLGDCIRGVTYKPEIHLSEQDTNDSVRLLRSNNVFEGQINIDLIQFVDRECVSIRQELLNGDILLCMANGSRALVGKAAKFLAPTDHAYTFGAFMGVFRPRNPKDSDYILFLTQSKKFRDYIDVALSGSSINNLRPSDISQMQFSIPETSEREVISSALRNIDDLVIELNSLIVKKHDVKKGLMQQLLTGLIRLPGFDNKDWQPRAIGTMLKVKHGRSQKAVERDGGAYPILGTGGEMGRANEALYSKPSVLIGRKGTIDKPKFIATPFWTVDTLFYTEINPANDPKFLYYKFCMIDWYRYNEASGVPSLNASVIERIEINTPLLAEQKLIAAVLSDVDAEIDALIARRDKIVLIKTGMIQNLLTGKVRL